MITIVKYNLFNPIDQQLNRQCNEFEVESDGH